MATIRKHRGKFQVQIRRKGFSPLTRTFLKLSDAKEWATLQERQADRGELGPDRKVLETLTLADLVTRYRDEVLPGKKGGKVEAIMLSAFLRHYICKKRLSDLTAADFKKWADEKIAGEKGKPGVTPKSAKRLLSPVQHMFELAMTSWDVPLRENPLSRLKLKVADNKRERRLRKGELDRLVTAAGKTRNPFILPVIRFALETAMRRGEILALRVKDVDIERCTATIRESKNGHSRTIPLTSLAVALLETTIAVMTDDAKVKNGRIFPITPIALRLAWDRLTKRAKIDYLNFHDLRHEAISRFFELGLTVPEVASISGHRDLRMLFRYAHATHASIRAKLAANAPSDQADGDGHLGRSGRRNPLNT
jgi:integrase